MSLRSRVSAVAAAFRGNPLENPAIPLSNPPRWLMDAVTGGPGAAGVPVNEQTAMQLATVYTCINGIASDVASLPLKVYQQQDKGKKPATDSDLYHLLAVEPNPEMSAPVFLQCWVACALLTGNGYAEIQRDKGKPVALWPRHPRYVTPRRAAGGELLASGSTASADDLIYEVRDTGPARLLPAKDMLHLTGLSMDGWTGLSPIQAARQTIGTAMAAEKFGAGFFGRGSRPSGLLVPSEAIRAGDPRLDQARESWENANSGENQGRTAVMPFGWTWSAIGISPDDAQFLESQQYSRTQIAALYRYPAHMAGDTSRLSNSNHESQALEYVTFTLRPWLVRIEAEVQRKLMPTLGGAAYTFTARFDFSELTRGDFASQMTGFSQGKQWGFYNTNMILERLGENPIGPEGDVFYVPLNMVPMGQEPDPKSADTGDAVPAGNGGRNQRMLVDRMVDAYGQIFRDGIDRMVIRSRRDADAVQKIFGPVLDTIAAEATRQAVATFRLKDDVDLGQEKILRDCRKAIEKRAADWNAATAYSPDGIADMQRAVRAIALGIFREAGSTLALAA